MNTITESIKLVSFDKSHIIFNKEEIVKLISEYNFPIYVISFLGEARFGKSTLINCFLTNLCGQNTVIFKTSGLNKHCTIGIDICIVKNKDDNYGYLILDCQGINHGDSSNDCKLMLMAYEISNMIVYNDKKLNNSTLKGLESMNLFERYIPDIYEKDKKPILMFRVRDYDLDEDIDEVLKDVMTKHDDQYNTLRRTLDNLYKYVVATKTNPLNKIERQLLSNHDYDLILMSEESEFNILCEKIKEYIITTEYITVKLFIDKFNDIVERINKSNKIDYKLLDIVSMNLSVDLSDYIKSIDTNLLYNKYKLDKTEKCFINCKNRFATFTAIEDNFNKTFSKCDDKIVSEYKKILIKRSLELKENMDDVKKIAYKSCTIILNDVLVKLKENIDEFTKSFINNHIDYLNKCKEIMELINNLFDEKSTDIMKSIQNEFKKDIINDILKNEIVNIYHTYNRDIINDVDEQIIINDKLLKNIINLNKIININIYKRYFEQDFIQNILNELKISYNPKYYEKFIDININVEYDGKITINNKYVKLDILIKRYNTDEYYINKINNFFDKSETKTYYLDILKNELIKYFNMDKTEKNYYNIIELHPEINFMKIDFNKLDMIFNKLIFIEDEFIQFVEDKLIIVDNRFTYLNILKLFSIKNDKNNRFIKFSDNSLSKKYVIDKIINYYGNIAFENDIYLK